MVLSHWGRWVLWHIHILSSLPFFAISTALEKPKGRLIHTPGRTHNRIGSPRFVAFGQQELELAGCLVTPIGGLIRSG